MSLTSQPATAAPMTAEELLRLPGGMGERHELIRGTLKTMPPPGALHGWIAAAIGHILRNFVMEHDLGAVFAAETGFKIESDPDTVRAPDAAFVASARLAAGLSEKHFAGAPDLAVEVLSPSDAPGRIAEKIAQWLDAGAREVWVVDPASRTLSVHQKGERPLRVFGAADTLADSLQLPGLALEVARLFPPDVPPAAAETAETEPAAPAR